MKMLTRADRPLASITVSVENPCPSGCHDRFRRRSAPGNGVPLASHRKGARPPCIFICRELTGPPLAKPRSTRAPSGGKTIAGDASDPALGSSSGFQSAQYRALEFLLGNKHAEMVDVFRHDPDAQAMLRELLHAPSLYDEFLRHLARRGLPVPRECVERDWTQPYERHPGLVPVLRTIYADPRHWWDAYDMCEKLVDIEESFQLWRFRHLKTVERIIGHKPGTGGSSGVAFLTRALDVRFFPELIDVRGEPLRSAAPPSTAA